MQRREPSPVELGALAPERVNSYARSRGWQPLARRTRQGARIFEHPGFQDRQLLLPSDQDVADYGSRMHDLLRTLAETVGAPLDQVVAEIETFDADILRFSVRSPDTDAGRIPLGAGVQLLEGARRALLAAACSVLQPQRHHPRMSRAEAEELLARCELGQTEQGSFVASVLCPLDDDGLQGVAGEPIEPPFTRRTTRLLMDATRELVEAIEDDRLDRILEPAESQPIVSSNLCDALLRMRPEGSRSEIALRCSWSRRLPMPEAEVQVRIRASQFQAIATLRDQLRPRPEPDTVETCAALVTTLNGDPGSDGRLHGEVTFDLLTEDGNLRARADLPAEDYELAARAHLQHAKVTFRARIEARGSRVARLGDLSGLRVLGG